MSHGFELEPAKGPARPQNALLAAFSHRLDQFNTLLMRLAMVALVLTALVLTYSVVTRYFFKVPTDWQDEAAVFCLVGATFLCAAFVQSLRGHVGIEAVATLLPDAVNRWRLVAVDLMCFAFCTFFSWKSWTLFHEAWVEQQTTSSSWAPPLSIPYGLMALGMSLLSVQLLVQFSARVNGLRKRAPGARA